MIFPPRPCRALALVAAFAAAAAGAGERWSRDAGVVDYYAKYTRKAPDRSGRAAVTACCRVVEAAGLRADRVDVDIFLPGRKSEREQYKRLVIPPTAEWFSRVMYQGMHDYVLAGGLLVTNTALVLEDVNDNYMVDAADAVTDFAQKHFLGIRGNMSCRVTHLKVLHDCPLTVGIPAGTWLELPQGVGSRRTKNVGAFELVRARLVRGDRVGEQLFMTFRHSGKGACIYFAGALHVQAGAHYERLVRNVFADTVVDWLCLQEPEAEAE